VSHGSAERLDLIGISLGTVKSMGDIRKVIWWAVIGRFRLRARGGDPGAAPCPRIALGVVNALVIVRPETFIRWHRAGFRSFWRWKSRSRGGRSKVPLEILSGVVSHCSESLNALRKGPIKRARIKIKRDDRVRDLDPGREKHSQPEKEGKRNHATSLG
jgi:hypothetical protein